MLVHARTDPEVGYITVARKGRKGKGPTQINLTPASYANTAATAASTKQPTTARKVANPLPSITEITVLRTGGHWDPQTENSIRARAADAIVREVRAQMAKAVAKPIVLRAGRWSVHPRSKGNFVFSFDGCIPFEVIQSYELLLLAPFYGSGQLCPSMGWTRFLVHGVPTWNNDEYIIFGPDAILREVRLMPGLKKAAFAMQPRWLKQVDSIETDYSSITFAISDPDGTITNTLLNSRPALFGKEVSVRKWVDKPPLLQCSRCHALGHNKASKACRLGKDSVKCHICGGAHRSENHNKQCPRNHAVAGKCDCKNYRCLNCQQPGHNCRDANCPARALFRPRGPKKPGYRNKGKERAADPDTAVPQRLDQEPEDPIGDLYDTVGAIQDPYVPIGGPTHLQAAQRHPGSPTQSDYDKMDVYHQQLWERDHQYNAGLETDPYAPPIDNSNPATRGLQQSLFAPANVISTPATRAAQVTNDSSAPYAAPEQYAAPLTFVEPLVGMEGIQSIQTKAYSPSRSTGDAIQMNLT